MAEEIIKGVASVSAVSLDGGLPAGYAWDPKYLPHHKVPVKIGSGAERPVPRVEVPAKPVGLTPLQAEAIDALAVALMSVQAAGMGITDAMEHATSRMALATTNVRELGPVERAFLTLAVTNGNAQE